MPLACARRHDRFLSICLFIPGAFDLLPVHIAPWFTACLFEVLAQRVRAFSQASAPHSPTALRMADLVRVTHPCNKHGRSQEDTPHARTTDTIPAFVRRRVAHSFPPRRCRSHPVATKKKGK